MKNIFIIAVYLAAVSCTKPENQKENLSLNLQKGFEQTLIYTTSTEGNENGGMNDATEVKYRIDSVDNNTNYYVTGEIMRMTFNQKMFGEDIHFDSRSDTNSDDGMGEEMKPLINNPFTFKIDKYGRILEKHKFTKGNLSEDISQYTVIPLVFPEGSVETDYKWTDSKTNSLVKTMSVSNEYTFKGIKDGKIEISVFSKMPGMEGLTKAADIEGNYIFDSKTKSLISAERNMPVQMGGGTATFKIIPKMEGFN